MSGASQKRRQTTTRSGKPVSKFSKKHFAHARRLAREQTVAELRNQISTKFELEAEDEDSLREHLEADDELLQELLEETDYDYHDEDEPDTDAFQVSTEYIDPGCAVNFSNRFKIHCHNGEAWFDRPSFVLGQDLGEGAEEHFLGWSIAENLAKWLCRERNEFIRDPSFLNYSLAKTDLTGEPPVLEKGLWQILGGKNLCEVSVFHRHIHKLLIVWPDFYLPGEVLFSRKAKLAWVAAAVIDRQAIRPFSMKLVSGDLRVTNQKKKQLLLSRSNPQGLDPMSYVQLALILTGVSWSSVVEQYHDVMHKP